MSQLRAYFAQDAGEEEIGFAVIAHNSREAKKIAYNSGELNCDYIDLRIRWLRNVNVEGLKKGMMADDVEALRRGMYSFVESDECDECGEVGTLQELHGKALCEDCYEKAEAV
jgi:hypothetical protein